MRWRKSKSDDTAQLLYIWYTQRLWACRQLCYFICLFCLFGCQCEFCHNLHRDEYSVNSAMISTEMNTVWTLSWSPQRWIQCEFYHNLRRDEYSINSAMISAEMNTVRCSCFTRHFWCHFCESNVADKFLFTVKERLLAPLRVHERPHTRSWRTLCRI